MRKLLKKILIGLVLVSFPILSFSQNHIIDDPTNPMEKSSIKTNNFKNTRTNVRLSTDSIHISSAEILSGDSVLMLTGAKRALITGIAVDYTKGSSAYVTTGSTDSTLVYSRVGSSNQAIAYIKDDLYEGESLPSYVPISTSSSESDSCYYYLKIPSSKYSVGDGSYILFYNYMILE